MEEVLVRQEIPLLRDRAGRARSTELLRAIRQMVEAVRRDLEQTGDRQLAEVGFRQRVDHEAVEVVLHFR